ncbi:hypothetical protein LTR97_004880 [Elasticomyces elasticus]|uniref:Extracellular membrane protein CFEM domain-containing protein n=1 Tax=Elasticomyces elasticus TaxID=574655 RepID=A0AAN7W811_9PEZI|nr:hypothetical protein LTR97_004880 [Elasticomyces elasticus]
MHYAPALLALAGLAAAYKIPPLNTTEWCLAKCNDVGGDSCVAACVGNPNLSAEQIHVAHECEFKCHIPSKGAEGDLACLRACHKRYYYATTSTKAATSTAITGGLARRSDLAASTTMFAITATGIPAPPLATPTAISLTPAEKCLSTCNPIGDRSCVAACIGNPSLSSAQVAAAHRCYSTCPMGDNDSVEDWNAYMTCLRVCDTRYYSTISTKAATSTAIRGCQVACQEIIFNPKDHFNNYYDPNTGTKVNPLPLSSADIGVGPRSIQAAADTAETLRSPTTTLHTTTTLHLKTTVTPAMSFYTPPVPMPSTKETCLASCIPGDLDCEYICIYYPLPYPDGPTASAYGDCDAACKRLAIMEEDADLYRDCLEECEDSYYDPSTNTKASAIAATNAGLGPRDPITAASPTRTPTSAMSSATHTASLKEKCIASCGPKDIDCAIDCINAESHFPGQDAAAQECEAACRKLIAMEKDPGGLPACLMVCAYSYDEVSTGNAQFTVTIPNSDLVPRATLTPAATTPPTRPANPHPRLHRPGLPGHRFLAQRKVPHQVLPGRRRLQSPLCGSPEPQRRPNRRNEQMRSRLPPRKRYSSPDTVLRRLYAKVRGQLLLLWYWDDCCGDYCDLDQSSGWMVYDFVDDDLAECDLVDKFEDHVLAAWQDFDFF